MTLWIWLWTDGAQLVGQLAIGITIMLGAVAVLALIEQRITRRTSRRRARADRQIDRELHELLAQHEPDDRTADE